MVSKNVFLPEYSSIGLERFISLCQHLILGFACGLYIGFLILLVMFITSQAHAKTVVYGSSAQQVRVKYGTPAIFRFSKPVQTITGASRLKIEPANKADPSYTVLSVTPRFTNGVNEVNFFLIDKSVVRTKIIVSPSDFGADTLYDFKSPTDAEGPENAPGLTEVELLKAMVIDGNVAGYKIHKLSQTLASQKSGTQTDLIRIYQGSPFNGYVFRVKNTRWRKNIEIDVRHTVVGNPNLAILSQSDESTLYPKGKGVNETLVRVVAKNTSTSQDVILQMEAEDPAIPKQKGGD